MTSRPHSPDGQANSLLGPDHDGQHGQSVTPQRWQIFWWLLTITLSAFILGTLKIYEEEGNFTSVQKHTFNTISTALILGLSLNFFEAFKSLAKGLQPRIRQRGCYNARERRFISNIENLTDVIELGWESLIKPDRNLWTSLLCTTWITINLVAQISVATISLTYTVVDGKSWNDTYTRPGIANASNLTCYFDSFNSVDECGGDVTSEALSHAYGEMALSSPCGLYNDTSDIVKSKYDYGYYCRRTRHSQEFAYRFNEYSPEDKQKVYPRFTQRVITASSGQCFNYSVVSSPVTRPDGNMLFEYTNLTFNGNITIPAQATAFDGTTYVYRGRNTPQRATTYSCGSRCIWMWAHKAAGHGEPSTFYQCPITVSNVTEVSNDPQVPNDTQKVSDGMARLAAASIALQGRPSGNNKWTQYQLYTYGAAWEVHFKAPDQVGADMAEFAIGSISTMARTNRQIQVDGLVPHLGSHLEVKWYYVIPLVAGICGAHLVLFISNRSAT